jgi:hypothetical protein
MWWQLNQSVPVTVRFLSRPSQLRVYVCVPPPTHTFNILNQSIDFHEILREQQHNGCTNFWGGNDTNAT